MSKIIIVLMSLMFILSSCEDAGKTRVNLSNVDEILPEELKGLKIYSVSTGGGNYVQVAVLNNNVASTTYQVGKFSESLIIVNKDTRNLIEVSNVLLENDSIIIFKK